MAQLRRRSGGALSLCGAAREATALHDDNETSGENLPPATTPPVAPASTGLQLRRRSGGALALCGAAREAAALQTSPSMHADDASNGECAPAPASVARPPRISPPPPPPPLGTLTPQDSMRNKKQLASGRDAKLLAAAGLDLFRHGFAFDGLQPTHHAPRHPAVVPNLQAIHEDSDTSGVGDTSHESFSPESQAIVVFGAGPLRATGDVPPCVAHRVARASQLYWSITKVFAELQANSHCYVIPMADESGSDSVRETEAIRTALIAAGISPHHIAMDCSAPNLIENALLLVPVLRHLHIETIHVVTSAFHVPRARTCIDGILHAVADATFTTRFHVAPDGLRDAERSQYEAFERATLPRSRQALDDAVRQQSQRYATSETRRSVGRTHSGGARRHTSSLYRSTSV